MNRLAMLNTRRSPKKIRKKSLRTYKSLGLPRVPWHLPLPDPATPRDVAEIANRACALSAVIAVSYGFNRQRGADWLHAHDLWRWVAPSEQHILTDDQDDPRVLGGIQIRVEALFALCWCVNFFESLDWTKCCPDELVKVLPDLKTDASPREFTTSATLRSAIEIRQTEDLAYCLHWLCVDCWINQHDSPFAVEPYVIVERRHALSWVLSDESWDDISLDT